VRFWFKLQYRKKKEEGNEGRGRLINNCYPSMIVHCCNDSTLGAELEAEAGLRVQNQPGLHGKTLFQMEKRTIIKKQLIAYQEQ
jgi:hypothetical protein